MSKAKKYLYGVGVLILAAVIVGVFLPARGQVQRQLLIDAPFATVFVLLENLDRAKDWIPWVDAGAGIDIAGRSRGTDASVRWDSERRGTGTMTIIESVPYERLAATFDLDDGNDVASTFRLSEADGGTRVVWTWSSDFGVDLAARYAGLFLESRIGEDLDRGLDNLATLAESLPRAEWSDIAIERLVVEPVDIAYLTATSLPNAAAISEAMGAAYFSILAFMDRHGLEEAGAPLSISRRFSGSEFVFDAAIPVQGVTEETPRSENGIRLGLTYGGPVVRGRHVGSYGELHSTHEKIAAYLAVHGISRAGDAWEVYVGDPARSREDELITDVYYPIED